MGEVYRARDARLHRDVALKVLYSEVAGNVGRLARFEQEARAVAALNHPNILGIHDIGSDQGVTYIATELVIGETLAGVIRAGPVPLRRLLDIAVQLAAGLACAHASGIVHRDVKPENVMVTKDGAVKILDFGLAKQTVGSAAASVTGMGYETDVGTILGTVNYMSPEQARGDPADHRSDQFSLGIVLYEMAAGRLPFSKASAAETLSAIIADEPFPIDNRTPPPLRWTIDRCLAKDPNGRYESTRDLAAELRGLREHLSETSLTRSPAPGRPAHALLRKALWYLAATVVGAAAVAGGMFFAASVTTAGSVRVPLHAVLLRGRRPGRSGLVSGRTCSGLRRATGAVRSGAGLRPLPERPVAAAIDSWDANRVSGGVESR